MTSRLGWLGFVAGLAIGAAACAEKTGADKFVGTWTYAGAINPNCLEQPPMDLTGSMVTITATDSSHIVMEMVGFCTVRFDVDGFNAMASSGQTCPLEVPGLGIVQIAITSWTLVMSGTDTVTSQVTGSALGCVPTGEGMLTRVGDAGAP